MIQRYLNYKIFILLFIVVAQLYAPKVYILGQAVAIDIFLIYLTYISTHNSRIAVILIGFLFGLIQDIITQYELLGLFAITKTCTGFILGSLNNYNKIWNKNIKMVFLFLAYFFHFIISAYLMFDRLITPTSYILNISLLQSIWTFLIIYIVNKFILIDNKIIE
tara:strand:+ start:117 stop:608 length:492 start_codon:yes stop_codon:yes gene_type:complete